jgi:putative transposase
MQKTEPLIHGQNYHIYNCGINGTPLFNEHNNYEHFLCLYEKYIEPIADTYAWCLMGNHFHLLVRIKDVEEIGFYVPLDSDGSSKDESVRFKTISAADLSESAGSDRVSIKVPNPTKHFSHLFNAYCKYFNFMYKRHGSLFERPFKRINIDNEAYLKQVVLYIHNNPVRHGFCNHPVEYAWSSFLVDAYDERALNNRNQLFKWFGGKTEFDDAHNKNKYLDDIKNYFED